MPWYVRGIVTSWIDPLIGVDGTLDKIGDPNYLDDINSAISKIGGFQRDNDLKHPSKFVTDWM